MKYTEALPTAHLGLLTVQELKEQLNRKDKLSVLDVRSDKEWNERHIEGAIHIYVGHLEERLDELPVDQPIAVICSVGNRASLGTNILERGKWREIYNVLGDMLAWERLIGCNRIT